MQVNIGKITAEDLQQEIISFSESLCSFMVSIVEFAKVIVEDPDVRRKDKKAIRRKTGRSFRSMKKALAYYKRFRREG